MAAPIRNIVYAESRMPTKRVYPILSLSIIFLSISQRDVTLESGRHHRLPDEAAASSKRVASRKTIASVSRM